MDPREFPTKGNLMLAKNSLMLARQGYDLMDKKRNILLKELMGLIDEAKDIQEEIDATFTKAYACLQRANIEHGISKVQELAFTVPIEDSLKMQTRSIMGTEIPHIKYDAKQNDLTYSFSTTHESVDIAREAFREVKELTINWQRWKTRRTAWRQISRRHRSGQMRLRILRYRCIRIWCIRSVMRWRRRKEKNLHG